MTLPFETGLAKARRRLLPLIITCYVICFVDRTNIGMAQLRMGEDLGLGPAGFGLAAAAFFVGYALFEVPSNLVLHRVGARIWIARIMVTWGLLSAATAFVTSPDALYVVRFALGVAEAGFYPGVILYFTYWFPRRERARIIALLMAGIPVSFLIANPVSGWLVERAGWQVMFVAEGLPAVVLGVVVWAFLPDRPANARWLTQRESDVLTIELAAEAPQERPLRSVLLDPRVLLMALAASGNVFAAYLLSLFLPQMVAQLWPGTGPGAIGLIAAVPYGFAVVAMVAWGRHSDRSGERIRHAAVAAMVAATGFAVAAMTGRPWLVLAALTVAAMGKYAMIPVLYSLPTELLSGRAAAAGIALVNSLAHVAAIFGPVLVGWLRESTGGFAAPLTVASAYVLLSAAVIMLLGRLRPAASPALSRTP
ncbi:MFS transporter [Nonomuraea sp. NBC_01738]|uniref:MFS transporter n=1 Tax=Nonomuraea sp. NBC_01738 TaxID=2976003 RepID=UPI002E1558F5|nr:MFS transporter [Nonomuraea sp. NBC_01738]